MNEKRKLVVIGNGMAGARTVEEILARGGGEQFQITMFGEEPTGNCNKILLFNVLKWLLQEEEIFLDPLSWYEQNGIRLLAGTRAAGLLRRAKLAFPEDGTPEPYDKLILATARRPFIPQIKGTILPDGSVKRQQLRQNTQLASDWACPPPAVVLLRSIIAERGLLHRPQLALTTTSSRHKI
jgi:nitrite reductase (NADH) large subunit